MIGHAHAPPPSANVVFRHFSAIIPYISCQTQNSSLGAPPVRAPSPFNPARDMEQVLVTRGGERFSDVSILASESSFSCP